MESFEHLCKVALEADGFIVATNLKFAVRRRTRRVAYAEFQEHGYEIDLVGARADKLVLAEVKSFFGSSGVNFQGFRGLAKPDRRTHFDRYKIFNDRELRQAICAKALKQFGYKKSQLEMRFYAGKIAKGHEEPIRRHLAALDPHVRLVTLNETIEAISTVAKKKTYRDDAVIMTIKALVEAGKLPVSGIET